MFRKMHQNPFDPPPQLLDPMYLYPFLSILKDIKNMGMSPWTLQTLLNSKGNQTMSKDFKLFESQNVKIDLSILVQCLKIVCPNHECTLTIVLFSQWSIFELKVS
jgi:hypothetical protein